jgi:SAM-dependent methyltransferase
MFTGLRRRIEYLGQYRRFARLNSTTRPDLAVRWSDRWPRLDDKTAHLPYDAHYAYHTAWAARVVAQIRPAIHVDISSYTYFATLVSAFIPVEFYDYRPADIQLSNLKCGAADLCSLDFDDRSLNSLSCMHTIEHIGLGRYGDPLDADGDRRALSELQRVLAPSGSLLVVVPTGRPRIQFNAHRIYSPEMMVAHLPELQLHRWALLTDDYARGLVEDPSFELASQQAYGCGCYWFRRPDTDSAPVSLT